MAASIAPNGRKCNKKETAESNMKNGTNWKQDRNNEREREREREKEREKRFSFVSQQQFRRHERFRRLSKTGKKYSIDRNATGTIRFIFPTKITWFIYVFINLSWNFYVFYLHYWILNKVLIKDLANISFSAGFFNWFSTWFSTIQFIFPPKSPDLFTFYQFILKFLRFLPLSLNFQHSSN